MSNLCKTANSSHGTRRTLPYMHALFNAAVKWPRGSIVKSCDLEYVNTAPETRKPGCGVSAWRHYDTATINLKLQRLGECGADFIFPPIKRPAISDVCDEPEAAQAWAQGTVGTFEGALWTPAIGKGTVYTTPESEPSDWCGPHTPAAVISNLMHSMCAG